MSMFKSSNTKKVTCPSDDSTTVLQLVAGVVPVTITEYGVSFDGTNSAHTPARVKLIRQTTAGTMTAEANQPIEYDSAQTAAFATVRVAATAEPTLTTDIYDNNLVTPIGGLFVKQYPLGREIVVQPGERLGIMVVAGLGSAASALAYIDFEE